MEHGSPHADGAPDTRSTVVELSLVYALTAGVTLLVSYTPSSLTRDYGHLLLAVVFLLVALHMAHRNRVPARHYGIDLCGVLEAERDERGEPAPLLRTLTRALPRAGSELLVALLVAALVFPPFILLFRLFHQVAVPFTLHLPARPWDFALGQLIVVALPEEALFRGYFQSRLHDLWPHDRRVLGASFSLRVLVCQAALFALLHFLVGLSPTRLAVFFPGLVFGLLREKRGGIGAAVWFHALCNLLSEILTRGYL